MTVRLLVVEDDDRIRAALRMSLEDEGYDVDEAADAESALDSVRRCGPPDLMIVDLMLGEMDGYTCIREVRRTSDLPIIVVSARADTHDIVAALEAGADDYVTKPFQVKEITARLRALRRRATVTAPAAPPAGHAAGHAAGPPELVLDAAPGDELTLDAAAGTARRGDRELHLTLTEFRLLCELASEPGRVLSRATLLQRVWDHGFFGDERLVDVHVRRLRTKIERDPSEPRVVVTVRGLGYRLDVQR